MNRILKLFLGLCFVFCLAHSVCAEEYKVLVLPDNIQFDSTNYLVYPDSSIIFASDTINEIKKNGKVQTVSMSEIREALRKNQKLSQLTKRALKEFKYNYNIPFVDFKAIANCFGTNKILVITSQTDVQNYILRRSIWDVLNVPGEQVVSPAYKLSTFAALIDVDKEEVVWQNTYYKMISSKESRMLAQNFAPATEQLEKIKSYSTYLLSPLISSTVQAKILPPLIPGVNTDGKDSAIVDVSNFQKQSAPLPLEEMGLKPKAFPVRPCVNNSSTGVIINDL